MNNDDSLRLLLEFSRRLNKGASSEDIVSAALEGTMSVSNPDMALLYFRHGDSLVLKGVRPETADMKDVGKDVSTVGQCLCGTAARGIPVYSNDIHNDVRCVFDGCKNAGLRSFAALPLIGNEGVLGVIGLASYKQRDFFMQSLFLETLAGILALALQDAASRASVLNALNELQNAMNILRERESSYQSMVSNAPLGMHFYELRDDGNLVFTGANPAADELLGVRNDQFMGKTIEEAFPPLAGTEVPQRYREAAAHGTSWMTERIEYRDDQITGAFEVRAFQTSPGKMVALFSDITHRKRDEKALKETMVMLQSEKAKTEAIIAAIGDGISIQDRNFRVLYQNQAHMNFVGDQKGNYCYQVYEKRDSVCEGCPVALSFENGGVNIVERSTHDDDGIHYFEITASPLKDPGGNIIAGIEVVREITERKRSEEELKKLGAQLLHSQKMEAVGRLAGGIAHDFNNILTAIIGYGSLLRSRMASDNTLYNYVDHMLSAAEKAGKLTAQLLAYSRKQIMQFSLLDLNEIIAHFEKIMMRIIGEDISLRVSMTRTPLNIMADRGQIEQVLMNLATNARDAMPEGGKLIISTDTVSFDEDYVRLHGLARAGTFAVLSFTDTGSGMDAETQMRIFEPFFTTKEVGRGTGLGLATVDGIIKQHEGVINVYSEPGGGTTFKIYLPLSAGAAMTDKGEEPQQIMTGTETILVAEDDEALRVLARLVLTDAGYKVIEAADGKEAIEKYRENADRIGLLLLDVVMPIKNGKEVYEAAKKINPLVRALFASGYSEELVNMKGIMMENFNYISKPFIPRALLKKIREVIDAP